MDLISAAAAVITARRKNGKNGIVEDQPPTAAVDIMLRINYLVSKFGRRFGERVKLDKTVLHEIRRLQPQLETVLAKVTKLQKESASSPSVEDGEVDERAAKLWRQVVRTKGFTAIAAALTNLNLTDSTVHCSLLEAYKIPLVPTQVNELKSNIEEVLIRFTQRVDPTPNTNSEEASVHPSARPLRFCQGAVLCQSGKVETHALSVDDKPSRWGFVCRYCFLEVADYTADRLSHDGNPVLYRDLLAASLVVACASLSDRRAYYKCLACYATHKMSTSPRPRSVRNESAVMKATQEEIQLQVLVPRPNVWIPTTVDKNVDVDVSPATSPETEQAPEMQIPAPFETHMPPPAPVRPPPIPTQAELPAVTRTQPLFELPRSTFPHLAPR
ncbi:hypothetical protein N658DRAFT_562189 [Parathielavia hyrcaniae]|uniref:Uncharacterized protein n=1 Tax=Parathielavia hyrcaniae TaxID=113614 RepID=A0AAN6SXD3_9PEZI|nr:hypothetical protein N658DRAFT_562189 [Parathielavia hyrcaniae]